MPNFISEDQIEQTLLQRLQHVHGYDVLDCATEEREDWADGSARADKRVANAVEEVRHANLPDSYDRSIFKTKCDEVFGLVLDHASHGRKWAA